MTAQSQETMTTGRLLSVREFLPWEGNVTTTVAVEATGTQPHSPKLVHLSRELAQVHFY
jgi:hypothetical protein